MREMPREQRPAKVIGCEVWRDLDWLPDGEKVLMDVSGRDNLAAALNGVFDSQIAGGKRYDLATLGRRRANATFFASHATDAATQLVFGIDLTPLVADESLDIADYVCGLIDQFKADVRRKTRRQTRANPDGNHHPTHCREDATDVAARIIAKLLREKPDAVLGLATGSTPLRSLSAR
jgi:hypothetical protein